MLLFQAGGTTQGKWESQAPAATPATKMQLPQKIHRILLLHDKPIDPTHRVSRAVQKHFSNFCIRGLRATLVLNENHCF